MFFSEKVLRTFIEVNLLSCRSVICEKLPFLHSLDVLIKMFANSRVVLTNKHWEEPTMFNAFKHSWPKVFFFCFCLEKKLFCNCFFSKKNNLCIPKLGSGLMVSGIDLKFTLLKYFYLCSRCMAKYWFQ